MTRLNPPTLICLLLLASGAACFPQESDQSFKNLKFKYEVERENYGKPLKALDASFETNLQKLEEKVAKEGELAKVLQVREEIALLGKPDHVKADGFVELERLQQIYDTELEKLSTRRDEKVEELMGKYLKRLEVMKKELTKAKKIDEAVVVGKEVDVVSKEREIIIATRKRAKEKDLKLVPDSDESEFRWVGLGQAKVLSEEKSPGQIGVKAAKAMSVIHINKSLPSRFVLSGEYYLNGPWGGFVVGLDPRSGDFLSIYSHQGGLTRFELVLGGVRKIVREEKVSWKPDRWTDFKLERELGVWKIKIGSKTLDFELPEGVTGRHVGLISYTNSSISVRKLQFEK